MTEMSDQEVSDLIEEHVFKGYNEPWTSRDGLYHSPGGDWEAEGWEAWAENADEQVFVPGLGLVSILESFGGEGQGDEYFMIFFVDAGEWEQYYKLGGYYRSYDGGYYDGPMFKVEPVVKPVTFWE